MIFGRLHDLKTEDALGRAKEILAGAKKKSTELAGMWKVAGGSKELKMLGEGSEAAVKLAVVDKQTDGSSVSSSKCKRASKTLSSLLRQRSCENATKQQESNQEQQSTSPPWGPNGIQFLASQPDLTDKDFDRRVTFQGDIRERITSVPFKAPIEEGIPGLEKPWAGRKSNASDRGSNSERGNGATNSAAAASGEALNNIAFLTMAPHPTEPNRSFASLPDLESKLSKSKKKNKKRKRGQGDSDSAEIADFRSSVATGVSEASSLKRKRSRARKGEGKGVVCLGSNLAELNATKPPPTSPLTQTPRKIMGIFVR